MTSTERREEGKGMRRAFTLIELLVVVAMIIILTAAMASSVSSARERARIQKATSDVKVISQAILASENYVKGERFELPTMERRDADKGAIGFLIGQGGSAESGGKIPALLMAQLSSGGAMRDPWGTPYKITIRQVSRTPRIKTASGAMQTGFFLPNFYRLTEDER